MPTVEINDVAMEALPGERLLDIARRNAAHIGFYCDGQGLCTTCECRILSGAEYLNDLTEAEQVWLPPARVRDSYRLGCQAALRGSGTVRTLTRAEELRRQVMNVVNPPSGTNSSEHLRPLLNNVAMINWEHIGTFPFNLLRTMARIGPFRMLWPVQDLNRLVEDTTRITRRMLGDDRELPSSQETPQVPARPASPPAKE
jgi:ferredoxin